MVESDSESNFVGILSELSEKQCTAAYASIATGSRFNLEFGPEHGLQVGNSTWSLCRNLRTVVGSNSPSGEIPRGLQKLIGNTVEEVAYSETANELVIRFTDGWELSIVGDDCSGDNFTLSKGMLYLWKGDDGAFYREIC